MPETRVTGGVLLEREAEERRVEALLSAAMAGRGGGLLVEGSAGIGKSAVLARGAATARRLGLRCLLARGGELEAGFGYGVVRQLLEREAAPAGGAWRGELIAGAAALAGPLLAPPPAGTSAPPVDAFAIQHGLYWLLANLAEEGPVALVVDDLHWADTASLRFLVYLCRRIEGMPVALLGAIRRGEAGARYPLLEALRGEPLVDRVELAKLGPGAAGELIRCALAREPEPAFAAACHEVSRGNPFLLLELLQTLVADGTEPTDRAAARVHEVGPPAVARSVLLRLARLDPAAVALAQATAVLGTASVGLAAALAGLHEDDVARAGDALAEAHVLSPGVPFEFHHPLIRTAIYGDLPAGRRARDHKRAAMLLAAGHASPERVTAQLMLAEPAADVWVVRQLLEAARVAMARGAPDAAVGLLQRALAEAPGPAARAEVVRALGTASFLAGDAGGVDHLREALALTEDARDWAAIALELGSILAVFEQVPATIELLESAIARLEPDDPLVPPLLAALLQNAAFDLTTATLLDERIDQARRQIPQGTAQWRQLLATLAIQASRRASADEAAGLAGEAIASGRMFDEQGPDILRSMYAVITLILCERFDEAATAVDQFVDHARARGSLHAFDGASAAHALLCHRLGSLADAEARAREALGAARTLAFTTAADIGLLLEVLVDRGDLDTAQAELEAADVSDAWIARSTTSFAPIFLRGRARLRIARGEVAAGLEDLFEIGRRCARWEDRNALHHEWRGDAALALASLGEHERARELALEELETARRVGTPRVLARALQALAALEGGPVAIDLLREAAGYLEDSPALLTRAAVLIDLGAALRRANQRQAARDPLLAGFELAHRCDARPLAERAQQELRAIGSRPRRLVRTGADALTASERRVCALAAQGLSNPEIAQTLFVTRATVESHLHAAYRKLGISTRGELAAALRR